MYDVAFGALASGNTTYFSQLVKESADDLMELQNKIERAIELQCAQVFDTGIIELNAGTNIDFKRKAASLVAYAVGNDFSVGTVSPYSVIEDGCKFIRNTGRYSGGVFNAILGSQAMSAFLDNTKVKERSDIRNYSLDQLKVPQANAVGGHFHGEVTCGSFKVRLWTYPEIYDSSGTATPYIDDKKVIILPEVTKFTLAYAAVPQLLEENGTIPQKGKYLIQDFKDYKKSVHEMHIKSAPVAIPTAVDQIYTVQVLS